jgi:hypothetical protein
MNRPSAGQEPTGIHRQKSLAASSNQSLIRLLAMISDHMEMSAMRRNKFDDEARIVAAIYAGQIIIFALGA